MIELKLIQASTNELYSLVSYAYAGDADLIDKFQAGERTYQECVDFNCNEILDRMSDPVFSGDMTIWKICLQSGDEIDDIGYCVTVKNDGNLHWLYSYAININYRKSVFLIDWLKAIENVLGLPYYTALWNKNTRAIDFFKKNGFVEKATKDSSYKLLFKGYEMIPKQQISLWQFQ